jgi:Flp pilus assembly protein CpaB
MTRKTGGYLLLAAGLVVTLLVALRVYQTSRQAAEMVQMESVDVLVAAEDVPERTQLGAPSLAIKRMLVGSVPPTAMSSPDGAVGRVTTVRIVAGDFILPAKLAEPGGRSGLAYRIPSGKVVVTLPGAEIPGAGALRPGDTVDVLATIKPADRSRGPTGPADVETATTQATLRDLAVLGIGAATPSERGDAPAPGSGLVTVAVDPQEALMLKALKDSERVKLELVLRAAGDGRVVETQAVTLATIASRYGMREVGP